MESGGELTKRGGEVDGVTCSLFVVVPFLLGDFCCWIWGIEACVLFARPFVVASTTIVTILFFVSSRKLSFKNISKNPLLILQYFNVVIIF